MSAMRRDLEIISDLISPGARVLDLGCGSGELLAHLQEHKGVNGYGLEIDREHILECVSKGVNVIEQDLDYGLANFTDESFDYLLMTETLQAVKRPDRVIGEMLRIGKEAVVTFPNFGHLGCRMQMVFKGRMPVTGHLPNQWYDTPNIHMCTFRDFEQFCRSSSIEIRERFVVDDGYSNTWLINRLPNLFGITAYYRIGRA